MILYYYGNNWATGISAGGGTIKNCYNIGKITSRGAGGIAGYTGLDTFNCYSIGKITSSYCGGAIQGMNYHWHMAHCYARTGDFTSLSSYNANDSYGRGSKQVYNYKCAFQSEDAFKTQDFIDELNNLITADAEGNITETEQNVWKMDTEGINNGYPIFVWQSN